MIYLGQQAAVVIVNVGPVVVKVFAVVYVLISSASHPLGYTAGLYAMWRSHSFIVPGWYDALCGLLRSYQREDVV